MAAAVRTAARRRAVEIAAVENEAAVAVEIRARVLVGEISLRNTGRDAFRGFDRKSSPEYSSGAP